MKTNLRLSFWMVLIIAIISLPISLHAQIITTIAGSSSAGYTGDGGAATLARVNGLNAVCIDGIGNIYLADAGNHCIRKVNTAGVITTVAGTGVSGYGGDGLAATLAQLREPAGVVIDAAGNLYIADILDQRIRKVNTAGIISTIAGTGVIGYSGDGGSAATAKFHNPYGVAFDSYGNLYIADQYNHAVRKITMSTGIISTVAGTGVLGSGADGIAATLSRISYPNYIYLDGANNIYISDNGNHKIKKVNGAGIVNTVVGTGTGSYSGDGGAAVTATIFYPTGIKLDALGNLFIADLNNSRLRKVNTAGIISTFCGTGAIGFSGDDGPATDATMNQPFDVAIDAAGNILFTDYGNNRLRKIDIGNVTPSFTGGDVQTLTVCENAAATAVNTLLAATDPNVGQPITWTLQTAPLHGNAVISYSVTATGGSLVPTGCTYTPFTSYSGRDTFNVWVNDGLSVDSIKIAVLVNPLPQPNITGAGAICTPGTSITLSDAVSGGTWSSSNTAIATVGASTGIVTAISAGVANITHTATNSCGTRGHAVSIVVGSNPIITTIAGTGISGYVGDGGAATAARFDHPHGVCIDAAGSMYITDNGNERIRKIDRYGTVSTLAGTGATGFSGDGGRAVEATFNGIFTTALDAAGNLYVSDGYNHRVRKIDARTGIITTIVGNGTASSGGDGGPASAATVNQPAGIAIDAFGNLYIAEIFGHRIRKINTSGIISTFAGTGAAGAGADGIAATSSALRNPNYMFMDGVGNVVITDNGNHKIKKVNTYGIVTTFAGSGTAGATGDGGAATAARLRDPGGIAIDAYGNTYIADYSNHKIRVVNTSGIITTYAGAGAGLFGGDRGPATAAWLNLAVDVAFDHNRNLIISDYENERIRKVTPNGCCGAPAAGSIVATAVSGCVTYIAGLTLSGASADFGIEYQWKSSTDGVSYTPVSGATSSYYNATVTASVYYKVIITCSGSGFSDSTAAIFLNYGLPVVGPITGVTNTCLGRTTTLADSTVAGMWTSSNIAVATIGTSGIVTGTGPGTAIISYSKTTSCGTGVATTTVTVLGPPAVTSVSPLIGFPMSSVTIMGANFNGLAINNYVYFGATRATVSTASTTSLTVSVPVGATYFPVTMNNSSCALMGYSQYPYMPTFDNTGYRTDTVSFDPRFDFACPRDTKGTAIGDIDGDGKPDVVVSGADQICIYKNIGTSGVINSSSLD